MRWTVVVPGALLPAPIAADVLAGAQVPWLMRALRHGRADATQSFATGSAPHLRWLWQRFGGSGEPVTAPYALQALGARVAPGTQCWHIDPVHFAFARDHLLVTPLDDLPPDGDDAARLAMHLRAALGEVIAEREPQLHLIGSHWLLTLARPWSMQASAMDVAIGQSAHEHWPAGADAAVWRKLLTEVQMRWHEEPVNEAREARGERAVNALWLHGGGTWAQLPGRAFATVACRDPVLRGWALASGLASDGLHEEDAVPPARGDAVSVRRDLLLPAQFEAWGQWLLRLAEVEAALQALVAVGARSGYDEIALALGGRHSVRLVRLRRRDAWRFWRKSSPVELLTEAEPPETT